MSKKFHLSIPAGVLEKLKDGECYPVEVRENIYAYITPEERCPNFWKNGRGYLLNFYCPNEGDFEVHETKKKPSIRIR